MHVWGEVRHDFPSANSPGQRQPKAALFHITRRRSTVIDAYKTLKASVMLGFRKKLRKLTRKELVPERPPLQTSVLASPRAKTYGLFLLSEDVPLNDSKESVGVDIVAIHGLNGDAYTTWQHENGNLWLRELLLNDLPGLWVFTYGYLSELFWSNSVATLRDYSRYLLMSLAAVSGGRDRPIIFICYSLGGIVCSCVSA
ncbi:uncharacterized protein M421DRAFT_355331 [Didymella exigua CBS 183.55]|uniref:DUF676 domain-containing protein n=1 Tax=Didymella exigua CBS 183.55 TaxID=1150837 RepID=A0A6A5R520_9PLEO|nr:uncharacterized protein M421DRAFT_355331 [Didymella exigua CBS 183.55]KAF1922509.1 hypothetical protein M421DRAFT_355331 [Didymella exigua CBS 183.55]